MAIVNSPFVGSEAIANGAVRKHELRSRYRAVFPDVYVPKTAELTIRECARAGVAVVTPARGYRGTDRIGLARREMDGRH